MNEAAMVALAERIAGELEADAAAGDRFNLKVVGWELPGGSAGAVVVLLDRQSGREWVCRSAADWERCRGWVLGNTTNSAVAVDRGSYWARRRARHRSGRV